MFSKLTLPFFLTKQCPISANDVINKCKLLVLNNTCQTIANDNCANRIN